MSKQNSQPPTSQAKNSPRIDPKNENDQKVIEDVDGDTITLFQRQSKPFPKDVGLIYSHS